MWQSEEPRLYLLRAFKGGRLMCKTMETLDEQTVWWRVEEVDTAMIGSFIDKLYFIWLRCKSLKELQRIGKIWEVSIMLQMWGAVPYANDSFCQKMVSFLSPACPFN